MAGGIESGLVQGRSVGWYSFHGNGRGEYGFGTEAPGSGDGDGRDGTGRIES